MRVARYVFVVFAAAGLSLWAWPALAHTTLYWVEFVAIAVVLGVLNARVAAARRARIAPPDDPRWRPSTNDRQRVGHTCPVCSKRIVVEHHAADCSECGAAFHRGCLAAHVVEHAEQPLGAYRARG